MLCFRPPDFHRKNLLLAKDVLICATLWILARGPSRAPGALLWTVTRLPLSLPAGCRINSSPAALERVESHILYVKVEQIPLQPLQIRYRRTRLRKIRTARQVQEIVA